MTAPPTTGTTTFEGFDREAIQFLVELAAHNERAWFQPRKAEYERLLKRPLEALCSALASRFAARGLPLRADPARSPFRIYRDTRFSRDKTPYKTAVSASFPWVEGGTEATWTGGYFHLAPGEIFVGGGMWHPEPRLLAAWRRLVVSDPDRVHDAVEDPAFTRVFADIHGDRLTRLPAGFAADSPDADLLKLKDVEFGRRLSDADAASPALPDLIADTLQAATPVLRLLGSLQP